MGKHYWLVIFYDGNISRGLVVDGASEEQLLRFLDPDEGGLHEYSIDMAASINAVVELLYPHINNPEAFRVYVPVDSQYVTLQNMNELPVFKVNYDDYPDGKIEMVAGELAKWDLHDPEVEAANERAFDAVDKLANDIADGRGNEPIGDGDIGMSGFLNRQHKASEEEGGSE